MKVRTPWCSRGHLVLMLLLALSLPAGAWPAGWKVVRTVTVPDSQLPGFSGKLGGRVVKLVNTFLDVQGRELKVNEVGCATPADAAAVARALGNPQRVFVRDATVTELVTTDPRLLRRAPYDLGLRPRRLTWRVRLSCAPLERCDYMAWNQMYNAWLKDDAASIARLGSSFRYGRSLTPRLFGQGASPSRFTFTPAGSDDKGRFTFTGLPVRHDVPQVKVEARVTSEAFAATPGKPAGCLGATARWPVPQVSELSASLVRGAQTPQQKVDALLDALQPGRTYKYGGSVRGSRWGVKRFLAQKTGECWDFSDAFITLARAAGVPARQVVGWLVSGHNADGHVWAEVFVDGAWHGVDPTADAPCGSDYVPLFTSEDGELGMVYTSPVLLEIVKP